jgi:hypothetical protein
LLHYDQFCEFSKTKAATHAALKTRKHYSYIRKVCFKEWFSPFSSASCQQKMAAGLSPINTKVKLIFKPKKGLLFHEIAN